jgi:hypothetical protein
MMRIKFCIYSRKNNQPHSNFSKEKYEWGSLFIKGSDEELSKPIMYREQELYFNLTPVYEKN